MGLGLGEAAQGLATTRSEPWDLETTLHSHLLGSPG